MLLQGLAGHNDVNKVDEDEGKSGQNPVHHPLESTSSIPQAKWQAQKLKEAKRGDDGSLRNVIWMHKNLKITLSQIDLRKKFEKKLVTLADKSIMLGRG